MNVFRKLYQGLKRFTEQSITNLDRWMDFSAYGVPTASGVTLL